jgi:hypothetical protein
LAGALQKWRVAVLVLIHEPRDAELAQLQYQNLLLQRAAGQMLRQSKQELGATVIFVTHSVFESVYLSDRIAVFSARPGRVTAEIEVAAPALRNDDFRLSQTYAQACRSATDALHAAEPGWQGQGWKSNAGAQGSWAAQRALVASASADDRMGGGGDSNANDGADAAGTWRSHRDWPSGGWRP